MVDVLPEPGTGKQVEHEHVVLRETSTQVSCQLVVFVEDGLLHVNLHTLLLAFRFVLFAFIGNIHFYAVDL